MGAAFYLEFRMYIPSFNPLYRGMGAIVTDQLDALSFGDTRFNPLHPFGKRSGTM